MVGKICNLSTSCPWGSKFDIQHSMSCKKDGFRSIGPLMRNNDLRDLTANMMPECARTLKLNLNQHHYLEKNCKVERQRIQTSQSTVVWEEGAKSFTRVWHK